MRKHFGRCALCGKECELTFEHIPPRAAFNSTPIRPVSGSELFKNGSAKDEERMPWEIGGLPYENQQQGMGRYSLCQTCNNNTGSWYGDAYVAFAQRAYTAIKKFQSDEQTIIGFKELYPLKIIKQVLSMFCSINSMAIVDPRFEPIREFVLDKNAVGLDKTKYKLCVYFTDSTLVKYAGLSVSLKLQQSGVRTMAMSEITAHPLGFILYFDPVDMWEYQGIDITKFADFNYDDMATIGFLWNVVEMNDIFPEHFRTKEEIMKCVEENKKWSKEHEQHTQT